MVGAMGPESFDTFHSYSNTFQMPFMTPWFPEKVSGQFETCPLWDAVQAFLPLSINAGLDQQFLYSSGAEASMGLKGHELCPTFRFLLVIAPRLSSSL